MIRNLPVRYPTLGRIRLGDEAPEDEGKPGKPLSAFRFTSNDGEALGAVVMRYGGTVERWVRGEQVWQLLSDAAEISVLLPPDAIETAYERWGSGGLTQRCDGLRCMVPAMGSLLEMDCRCAAQNLVPHEDREKGACVATVRVRVVLPDIPGLGIWLCTSHSEIAVSELGAQADLLAGIGSINRRAQLVEASLGIEERRLKKAWEPYERKFNVPVLRLRGTLAELAAGARPGELAAGDVVPPATLSPPAPDPPAGPRPQESTTPAAAGPAPPPLFTEADEVLVDVEWRRRFIRAARAAHMSEDDISALLAAATGGRVSRVDAVHKTDVPAVRRAFHDRVGTAAPVPSKGSTAP